MPFTEKDIAAEDKLRLVVYGPSKGGKTCSVLLTSPKPVFVINCEKGGLAGAQKLGAKFDGEHCLDWPTMQRVMAQLKQDCTGSRPRWRTIVLDTFSTFAKLQEEQLVFDASNTMAAWGERDKRLTRLVLGLRNFPNAHVVVISHAQQKSDTPGDIANVVPAVSGQIKNFLPAQMQDVVWLEVTPPQMKNGSPVGDARREFLVNPQGNWTGGARSMTFVGRIDADVTEFIKRAGIRP